MRPRSLILLGVLSCAACGASGDVGDAQLGEGPPSSEQPPLAEGPVAPTQQHPAAEAPPVGPLPGGSVPADTASWTTGIVAIERETEGAATLLAARAAAHPGLDRFVLEFDSVGVPGYRVEYVERPIVQCGSGEPVEVEGEAWLRIRLYVARAHTDEGRPTITERSFRPGTPQIREARLVCDFEGYIEWILGVAAPTAFRAYELDGPPRLAVELRIAN